jgi:hypothetical protein
MKRSCVEKQRERERERERERQRKKKKKRKRRKKMFWFAGDFYSYKIPVTFIATKFMEVREGRVVRLITSRKKWRAYTNLALYSLISKFFGSASNISARLRQTFRRDFVKRFGAASNISAQRQTFQLDVKHFSSTSSKRWELNQLIVSNATHATHATQIFLMFLYLTKLPVLNGYFNNELHLECSTHSL